MKAILCAGAVVCAAGLLVAVAVLWLRAPVWVAALATLTSGPPAVFLVAYVLPQLWLNAGPRR